MIIRQINESKDATVTLDCQELCLLANSLRELSTTDSCRSQEFDRLHRDIYVAFEVMSQGNMNRTAVATLQELQEKIDKWR